MPVVNNSLGNSEGSQREHEARLRILQAIEQAIPGIVGNPYIPHWPFRQQAAFLAMPYREAFYGGSAGGGKSDALIMGALQYVDKPSYSAILFRRTYTDLALPGALMDRMHQWLAGKDVSWSGTDKQFRFPSGAKVSLAYLAHEQDKYRYQSAEFQFIGFDELTQFSEAQYTYVGLSRLRRNIQSVVPLRCRSASNPGNEGHVWVKKRFVKPGAADRPFIPASMYDNAYLDRDSYAENLKMLHPLVREQLLSGNWDARPAGDYFRREWFGPLLDAPPLPSRKVTVRHWDLAASESEDAKRTAGVKMSKTVEGWKCIEHALAFKATPGKRDDIIIQTAQSDGYGVAVSIEIEPGSGGIAQYESLRKKLREKGFRVLGEHPTGSKESRCDPVAAEAERGFRSAWTPDVKTGLISGIRIVAGAWVEEYLDEVEGFPDAELIDLADATSGAFACLATMHVHAAQKTEETNPLVKLHAGTKPEDYDTEPEDKQSSIRDLVRPSGRYR